MFQIERDANAIAQQTRRGKGNFIITSADVASALAMSGTLDYSSGLTGAGGPSIGEVDDTGNLLVGTMNGRIKVYVDPYSANVSNTHYYVVGYKGSSPYDAGLFYCPYVPLQMLRSIDPETFQDWASRPATAWLRTHSLLTVVLLMLRHLPTTSTSITEEFVLRTSCDIVHKSTQGPCGVPFFMLK